VLPLPKGLRDGLPDTLAQANATRAPKFNGETYLQNLLILLRLSLVDLLNSFDILLDVDNGMLVCLKSFGEKAGSL